MMGNTHFDIEYLRRYVQGDLSASEMHTIERAAHEDEMLMDIINGLEFEFENNISNNQNEINEAILKRSKQKSLNPKNKISLKSIGIAASMIFLLGLATVFYLKTEKIDGKEQLIAAVDESTSAASPSIDTAPTDSSTDNNVVNYDTDEDPVAMLEKPLAATKSHSNNPSLTDENSALALVEESKKSSDLDLMADISNKGIGSNAELEEVIVNSHLSSRAGKVISSQKDLLLMDAKATLANTNKTESIAYKRAKLSIMNLDTNTQRILSESIDRQEKEQQITSLGSNNQFILIDTSASNAIAFRKMGSRVHISKDEGLLEEVSISLAPNVSSKKTKKSVPLNNLETYKNNIITIISKNTAKPFYFKIQFSLNEKGEPENIKFLKSSNSAFESMIIDYLKNEDKWIIGKDYKKVILELKK